MKIIGFFHGGKRFIAKAGFQRYCLYLGKSDYNTALKYSLRALQQFQEIGDKTGTARMFSDIGIIHWYQSDYPNALKYYFDALRIHEEAGNKPDIAVTLCNIGIVYNSQKEYQKAFTYLYYKIKHD